MKYNIIIATSQNRTNWLINRSIYSVYSQVRLNKIDWSLYVVDDNEKNNQFNRMKKQIYILRKKLNLKESEFKTTILKNTRNKNMSGTGAWNTALFKIYKRYADSFVAILDDDDEYLPDHLYNCLEAIRENTVAVFQYLQWKNSDGTYLDFAFNKRDLRPINFFIGNPGIQGSNMFFKTKSLIEIDGFDESLPNTTDRDLMIRFLWNNNFKNIVITRKLGVIHHNHTLEKVNNNITRKHQGLDLFYKKYKNKFSDDDYIKSLIRSKKYFSYNPNKQIVICMPVKNSQETVLQSIYSILNQKNVKREIIILVGVNRSKDDSESIVRDISIKYSNVIPLEINHKKVYQTRNFLNEYTRKNFPNCDIIGRLDADDLIYDEFTLRKIEELFEKKNFDVLICGNVQVKNGILLNKVNQPSIRLLQPKFFLNKLYGMTLGNYRSELPSCNTFIKPKVRIKYPAKQSAEDHWFTSMLMLQKDKLNIIIESSIIYCYYSLNGLKTLENKKANFYAKSRLELYEYIKRKYEQIQ